MRIRRSRFKRLVILASLLLTASAPMTVSGCIDGNSSGPSCRENGESCLGDSLRLLQVRQPDGSRGGLHANVRLTQPHPAPGRVLLCQ
jgi:hypothetical protein